MDVVLEVDHRTTVFRIREVLLYLCELDNWNGDDKCYLDIDVALEQIEQAVDSCHSSRREHRLETGVEQPQHSLTHLRLLTERIS